jgi:hypothetical protein
MRQLSLLLIKREVGRLHTLYRMLSMARHIGNIAEACISWKFPLQVCRLSYMLGMGIFVGSICHECLGGKWFLIRKTTCATLINGSTVEFAPIESLTTFLALLHLLYNKYDGCVVYNLGASGK